MGYNIRRYYAVAHFGASVVLYSDPLSSFSISSIRRAATREDNSLALRATGLN